MRPLARPRSVSRPAPAPNRGLLEGAAGPAARFGVAWGSMRKLAPLAAAAALLCGPAAAAPAIVPSGGDGGKAAPFERQAASFPRAPDLESTSSKASAPRHQDRKPDLPAPAPARVATGPVSAGVRESPGRPGTDPTASEFSLGAAPRAPPGLGAS